MSINEKSKHALKTLLLPLGIVGLSVLLVVVMIRLRSRPEAKETTAILPTVEVLRVHRGPHRLEVVTHGSVQPRTETSLTSEVSGVVVEVSPSFFPGEFFEEDQVLLRLDDTEYRAAYAGTKSRLAQAALAIQQERALADQALEDWEDLGNGEPSKLVLRQPQLVHAQAELEAAQASLALAERNLRLTVIRAPYAGRVREKFVSMAEVVTARMTPLARIYALDMAEVRLPISAEDAAYVYLPESFENNFHERARPKVFLEFDLAGETVSWQGLIDRVEGVIDTTTRQIVLVAQVMHPYRRDGASQRPPLKPGQFVEASIQGHYLEDATLIPRGALHGNKVYVIDENNRLRMRVVKVAQKGIETVVAESGLKEGEFLCLTPLEFVVDGMEVIVEKIFDEPDVGTGIP